MRPGKTIWCDSEIVLEASIQALAGLHADSIRTLLEDPRHTESGRAAARQLARLPGAVGAADVIEALPQA